MDAELVDRWCSNSDQDERLVEDTNIGPGQCQSRVSSGQQSSESNIQTNLKLLEVEMKPMHGVVLPLIAG
jgi:hypothetical protein